jgi:hypothetical protein
MGLLNRRRQAPVRGPEVQAAPPAEPADRPVIRAADLAAPGWTTLPPIPPTLAPMRLTAARQFEQDLVARQPLDLKLAPLGHALSESAPAGVVEAVAVLAAEAPDGEEAPARDRARLDLAIPPAPPAEAVAPAAPPRLRLGRAPSPAGPPDRRPAPSAPAAPPPASAATVPSPVPAPPLPVAGTPAAAPPAVPREPLTPPAPATAAATPAAPAEAPVPVPLATVPLASEQPIVPVEPLTPPALAATPGPGAAPAALPLVRAAMPAEVPVVALASTRLPEEQRRAGDVPPAPTSLPPAAMTPTSPPAPAPATSLVGDRPLAQGAAGPPAADPGDHPPAPPDPAMPLADPPRSSAAPTPPPSPGAERTPPVPLPPEAPGPALSPKVDAPLLGTQPLLEPPAAAPPGPAETSPAAPSPEMPVVLPDQPAATAPDRARRPGLGAPLAGLPPTARSFDPTGRSPAPSLHLPRPPARRAAPGQPAVTPPAPPGPPLPLASWSAQGPALTAPAPRSPTPAPPARRGPLTWAALPELPVAGLEPLTTAPAPTAEPPLALRPLTPFQPFIPAPDADAPAAPSPGPTGARPAPTAPPLAPVGPGRALPSPAPAPGPAEGNAVRASVGQRHGVDLRHVPIDRSIAGAAQAARIGARAYTHERGVVIPPQVGTLDAGEGRALLAHELTHVAQRTRLGAAMPPEHTPAGQTLEAQAQTAELALAPAPPPPSPPPPPAAAARAASAAPPGGPLALATPQAKTAELDETSLLAAMQKLSDRMGTSTPPAGQPQTIVMTPPAPAAAAGVQRASVRDMVTQVEARGAERGPSDPREASVFAKKPSDTDLSRLARWLYPLISYRLKGELREDRERAGLLTDTYRRW